MGESIRKHTIWMKQKVPREIVRLYKVDDYSSSLHLYMSSVSSVYIHVYFCT